MNNDTVCLAGNPTIGELPCGDRDCVCAPAVRRAVRGSVPLRIIYAFLEGSMRQLPVPANKKYARIVLLMEGP